MKSVAVETIQHHINKPWQWQGDATSYFFCDTPRCEAVYVGADGSIIRHDALRHPVGCKQAQEAGGLLCYCYGIDKQEAAQSASAKQFVIEQTRLGNCACTVRNPSGRCCLKDFKAASGS